MNEDGLTPEVERALRSAFAPPPAEQFAAVARAAAQTPEAARRWPWLVAAAALLAVWLVWWTTPAPRGPEGHDGAQLGALWAAAFHDAERQGFGMDCCHSGMNLREACRERLGCGLDVAKDARLAVLGTYAGGPTGGGMTLLAQAGSMPMCVCVLPRHRDPRVQLPKDSGLVLGRRELGEVVVYAVAKGDVREALAAFVAP